MVAVSVKSSVARGQRLGKFIPTKNIYIFYIRKECDSHRTGLGHQHGRRFIVLEHQYGGRDVVWKACSGISLRIAVAGE